MSGIPPTVATAIILGFLGIFGVVLPILNRAAPKCVSYRWCVVVVVLSLLVGVTLDFGSLSDDIRGMIILGALIIAGGYVLLRTIEKALANGWFRGVRLDVRKGDASATLSSGNDPHDESG